jgi:hypothetical protein
MQSRKRAQDRGLVEGFFPRRIGVTEPVLQLDGPATWPATDRPDDHRRPSGNAARSRQSISIRKRSRRVCLRFSAYSA